jgi:hypothetical protein
VEQRLVDAGLLGDLLHAGARGSVADEDGAGGVEDPLLGIRVASGRRRLAAGFNHLN